LSSCRGPGVLILDGAQRSALATARSLGRRGIPVRVGDARARSLAGSSRYCRQEVTYPDPGQRPADFVDFVLNEADSSPSELIVPITDVTTMLLLTDGRLGSRLVAPSLSSYEALSDKQRLLQLAASLGIPTPQTVVANSVASAVAAMEVLGFPAVIKPARSRYLCAGQVGSTSVSIAHDMTSAHRILTGSEWLKDIPALVQRYVPGSGAGVFGLARSGRPIAWFSHQRLREKPPHGGVSVLSESTPANDKLVEMSAQLLGAVDWTGVAMVEYRISPDGEPFLMEVNGRFWGSLQLSVDAGIDFPWLLYQMAIGEQIPETHEYRLGARLHWVLGDLDNLLIQIRDPTLCPNWKLRYRAIAAFVNECLNPRSRSEVFRVNDPLPALYEFLNWVAMLPVLPSRWRL